MKDEYWRIEKRSSLQIVRLAIIFIFLLYIVWIGAWFLERILEQNVSYMTTSQGKFVFWLSMRVIVWVIPAIVLIRYSGRKFVDVMGVQRLRSLLLWGGVEWACCSVVLQ